MGTQWMLAIVFILCNLASLWLSDSLKLHVKLQSYSLMKVNNIGSDSVSKHLVLSQQINAKNPVSMDFNKGTHSTPLPHI